MSDFNPIGALSEAEKRKIVAPPPMPQKNESKIIIGLTGPAAAGKETISKKFMDAGFEVFVFSDILRREAQSRGLLKGSQEEDRMIISKLGDIVRFISGKKDIIADALVREILSSYGKKFVVDGFRSEDEVFLFRKTFGNFKLIYVNAESKIRFERRKLQDPTASYDNFLKRDELDIKNKGMDKVFKMADARIDNNGDAEKLNLQVMRFLNGF
ncbi:MAG TPA: AAA family ATPase [archaeon]|nr:AAA family ATPase [archaeon]